MTSLLVPVSIAAAAPAIHRYSRGVIAPRRLLAGALAAAALLPAAVGSAGAAEDVSVQRSPLLWATVNRCLTSSDRYAVGIRASMPGVGDRRLRMYMRFQLQYFDGATNKWRLMGGDADSGFILVGNAAFKRRESGTSFGISAPPQGGSWRLRGLVSFEWRKGRKVVQHAREATVGGHKNTRGSAPKGFSAAECTITE